MGRKKGFVNMKFTYTRRFTNAISAAKPQNAFASGKKVMGGFNYRAKDRNPIPPELTYDDVKASRYDLDHPTANPFNGLLRCHYEILERKCRA